jgi:hypothetical protein
VLGTEVEKDIEQCRYRYCILPQKDTHRGPVEWISSCSTVNPN